MPCPTRRPAGARRLGRTMAIHRVRTSVLRAPRGIPTARPQGSRRSVRRPAVCLRPFHAAGAAGQQTRRLAGPSSLRDDRALQGRRQHIPTTTEPWSLTHAVTPRQAPTGRLGRESERPGRTCWLRALGPVAGRAIVTERRMFLAQIDAAEERCRQRERELQAERELVPTAAAGRRRGARGEDARGA